MLFLVFALASAQVDQASLSCSNADACSSSLDNGGEWNGMVLYTHFTPCNSPNGIGSSCYEGKLDQDAFCYDRFVDENNGVVDSTNEQDTGMYACAICIDQTNCCNNDLFVQETFAEIDVEADGCNDGLPILAGMGLPTDYACTLTWGELVG